MRKPVFTTVDKLQPGQLERVNLKVKVVNSTVVVDKQRLDGSKVKIAEVLVGDDTGCIVFTARNEQIDVMKPGSTVELRNAKVEMFNMGFMRLAVDRWGKVTPAAEPAAFNVNTTNNLSAVEYVLVNEENKPQ